MAVKSFGAQHFGAQHLQTFQHDSGALPAITGDGAIVQRADTVGGRVVNPTQAGVTFVPLRAARVAPRGHRLALVVGEVVARGTRRKVIPKRIPAGVGVLPVMRLHGRFGSAAAIGYGVCCPSAKRLDTRFGRLLALGEAVVGVTPERAVLFGAEGMGTAGAQGKPAGVILSSVVARASAQGVLNPTDEEIVLLYRHVRSNRHLLSRKHYGI